MKILFLLLVLLTNLTQAQVKPETFVVQISDRSMMINAPEKRKTIFSVLVENRSLSDQIAKLTVRGKLLKYVSVKSGQSEAVEVENKTDANVVLVPVSPAFQEAELTFGKKAYEIPSKE